MTAEVYYSRAPIIEALLDIRVQLARETTLDMLNDVNDSLSDDYPTRRIHTVVENQVVYGDEVQSYAQQVDDGYIFVSRDERQMYQSRLDGFSMNRLVPYDQWATFSAEAHRIWQIYRSIARPEVVTRVGLRYINRLDIPLPISDIKLYLRTLPEVSTDLPFDGLARYFMQLHIPQNDIEGMLVITQALVPPARPEVLSILLDIDVFREAPVTSEEELWEMLEQLHGRKNEVFEACITRRTRELIR